MAGPEGEVRTRGGKEMMGSGKEVKTVRSDRKENEKDVKEKEG